MLNETKPWLPAKWDYEADVVVVGYGGAGAAAAIEAHDAGATVLILEKQQADTPSFIDHTPSTRMAASAIATALGFTGGATDTGSNANPGTSKITLSQAVDPSSSQVADTKAFAILALKTDSMTLTNVSQTEALNYQVAIFGDLTPVTC